MKIKCPDCGKIINEPYVGINAMSVFENTFRVEVVSKCYCPSCGTGIEKHRVLKFSENEVRNLLYYCTDIIDKVFEND